MVEVHPPGFSSRLKVINLWQLFFHLFFNTGKQAGLLKKKKNPKICAGQLFHMDNWETPVTLRMDGRWRAREEDGK